MFYEKEEKKPILVDGQLVVYAFDETGRAPTDNKPTRRYVFPAEQIPLHMSKSEFGTRTVSGCRGMKRADRGRRLALFAASSRRAVQSSRASKRSKSCQAPSRRSCSTTTARPSRRKLPEGVPSKPAIQTLQTLQAAAHRANGATKQANYEVPAVRRPGGGRDDDLQSAKRMTATTITLPNDFQMPSAATLMAQNSPAGGHMGLQPYAGQPVLQQTPVATAAAMQQMRDILPDRIEQC